jgi:hypothetical protein
LPATTIRAFEARATSHTLVLGATGDASVRWMHRGRELAYRHSVDQISFFPADGDSHVRCYSSGPATSTRYVLHIPTRGLGTSFDFYEEILPIGCGGFVACDDSELRKHMIQLFDSVGSGLRCDTGYEIAARQLLLRLSQRLGGKRPDWQNDASVFTAPVMKQITEYVDSHLSSRFCLADTSAIVGCSPSHFARKFHRSVGMSLGRFINRRRLAAAMAMLRDDSVPLPQIAFSLGFSSQSHFTRLFSELVGMPPLKFRKRIRPTVG